MQVQLLPLAPFMSRMPKPSRRTAAIRPLPGASPGRLSNPTAGSHGGPNSWDNCVWASKQVYAHKGNRLPDEVGLKLLKVPRAPRELPVSEWIENHHEIRDWRIFLH
jgi:hypothetical protein